MKVGCIGLGDIAQKAYLPVLALQPGIDSHLQTRTPATLDRVADSLRVPHEQRHTDLDGLLAAGPRRGLRARADRRPPRDRHPAAGGRRADVRRQAARLRLADSERLVRPRRGARHVSLAVGFNRRYAPGYAQCADHPRELILMQKNRVGLPEEPRTMVLDDFIHVVDTLRFLVPGTVDDVTVRARVEDGLLHHVVLQLAGDGFTALGVMNRLSGSTEEILEVSGQDTKRQVLNLAEVIDHKGAADRAAARRLGAGGPAARHRAGRARLPRRRPRGQGAQRPGRAGDARTVRAGPLRDTDAPPGTLNHRDFSAKSPARISGPAKRGAGSATWRRRTRDGAQARCRPASIRRLTDAATDFKGQCSAPLPLTMACSGGVRISRKHERQIVPSAERTPAPRPIRPSSKSAIVESPVIRPQRRSKR